MESYEYIRVEEMKSLIKMSNVIGEKYLDESEARDSVVSGEEFKKMIDELFLVNGVLNIGDFIPWIDFMDPQGYVKRMKVVSKKFDSFLEHVLNEHSARRNVEKDNFVPLDMVDLLLQHADDPTLQVKFERNNIKGFILDLLAGGTETSAVTVEWAIAEILKKPGIFRKATEELDAVIGRDRWVNEK
ncbi:cytochrome P450 71A1-like protein, partial [Tanacetum coccineum]